MLTFHSGYSKSVNPEKAIIESVTQVAIRENIEVNLVVLHATLGYNLQKLLDAFHNAHPEAEIIGCTGSGVISNGWVSESKRALATMIVSGKEFSTSFITGITVENSESLAQKCAMDLKSKNPDINMLMAFIPGVEVNADGVIAGIESVFGENIPILGGTSGFAGLRPRTPVFYGKQLLDQSAAMVGFSDSNLEVIQVAHHGYLPQKDYSFEVTETEGNQILELNGEPAWPVLMKSFNLSLDISVLELIPIMALGISLNDQEAREYANEYILRAPLIVEQDRKSFHLSAPIKQGTMLISCQRDEKYIFEGMESIGLRYQKQLNKRKPLAVFQMDCMARGRKTIGLIEKNEIIQNLQDSVMGNSQVPWLGDYGFGEFSKLNGRNRFHNYTTTVSVIIQK